MSELTDLVPDPSAVSLLAAGGIWVEGPLWIPSSRTLRWSDIPANRIMQWDADTHAVTVYAEDVEFTNGRALDPDGSVVQCSHGHRRVERERDGVVESVVDRHGDARLNSPNDVVIAPDGAVWFTDPTYGITQPREGHPGEREYGACGVFRVDPDSGRLDAVVLEMEQPNGLAFSPDGRTLYVADSSASGQPIGQGNRWIRAYDVVDGVRCENGRVFADLTVGEGIPDGIKVDEHGNVWTSGAQGLTVIAADGRRIGLVPIPELVANLCFGGDDGRTVFVAALTSIYAVPTTVRDATTTW